MPFIGDLPPDHEIFASGNAVRSSNFFFQNQVEEYNSSPLRVDSPGTDSEESDSENEEDIGTLADMLNHAEENGRHEEKEVEDEEETEEEEKVEEEEEDEEEQAPVSAPISAKCHGRPSKGSVSPKITPAPAVKMAGRGRGRPRADGLGKPPAKTPTKGVRASARVQEITERPVPVVREAAAKKTAGKKRGRPAASRVQAGKRAKTSQEPEFEVEKIIDSAIDNDSFEHMYLVKWKGFSAKENTWEPKENLSGCLPMVYQFDEEHKKAQAKEVAAENKKMKVELAAARIKAKAEREAKKAKAAAEPRKPPAKRGRKPKKPKSELVVRGRPKKT